MIKEIRFVFFLFLSISISPAISGNPTKQGIRYAQSFGQLMTPIFSYQAIKEVGCRYEGAGYSFNKEKLFSDFEMTLSPVDSAQVVQEMRKEVSSSEREAKQMLLSLANEFENKGAAAKKGFCDGMKKKIDAMYNSAYPEYESSKAAYKDSLR